MAAVFIFLGNTAEAGVCLRGDFCAVFCLVRASSGG